MTSERGVKASTGSRLRRGAAAKDGSPDRLKAAVEMLFERELVRIAEGEF
jgi:hypothetical protein